MTFTRLSNGHVAPAARLGLRDPDAEVQAETLLIAIEGGWMFARARRDSGVLRCNPQRHFP